MLSNRCKSGYHCLAPELKGKCFQLFTFENNVCCRLTIYDIPCIEVCSFYAHFFRVLIIINGHLIFDKGDKNIQWRKDNLLNKWCWENCSTTCKRMKLEHFLTPYTIINSKWIKDLNVRPETIKLLEENIGKTLSDINHSRILYDQPPRVIEIKAKINRWNLIKLKSFCTTKGTISKVKRQTSEGRK